MNIFAVFGIENKEPIAQFIEEQYSSNFFKVKDDEWFVASNKTTSEINDFFMEHLKPKEAGSDATFIIIPVSNWNGWSRNDMWEWLSLKSQEVIVTTEAKESTSSDGDKDA